MSGPRVLVDAEHLRTLLRHVEGLHVERPSEQILDIIVRFANLALIEVHRAALGQGPTHYLTMPEEDAVEVFGALDLASQIHAMTGNTVTSRHYADLKTALQARSNDQE